MDDGKTRRYARRGTLCFSPVHLASVRAEGARPAESGGKIQRQYRAVHGTVYGHTAENPRELPRGFVYADNAPLYDENIKQNCSAKRLLGAHHG